MTPQLTAHAGPGSISLLRTGDAVPVLVQQAQPDHRPYIHPLMAPDGRGILTEDRPAHHPWQHGIYTGLNDVNGAGFWTERLSERTGAADGTFHPRPLAAPSLDGGEATWKVECEWRAPDGQPLLDETQRWHYSDGTARTALDLEWTLRARRDLVFGRYQYGGLFLRMPYRKETGGQARTSEGHDAVTGEGQRARWVALSMPVPGRDGEAGIALLDHPGNAEHPVPWRIDSQLGICPSRCIAGAWRLPAGDAAVARYRVLAFGGGIDATWIEAQWRAFAAS